MCLLNDAKYQISTLKVMWFQTRMFFLNVSSQNLFITGVTSISNGLKPFEQFLKKGYVGIITTKFGQYPASCLGRDVL